MDPRLKLLLAALAVCAVVVVVTSASLAGNPSASRGTAIGHFDRGPIRGSIMAEWSGRGIRGRVHISLHGLARNTPYQVVGSPRPCSLTGDFNNDGVVDAADYVVWRRPVRSQASDAFQVSTVTAGGALNTTRSVRVFSVDTAGRFTQRACAGVDVWEHAYS